MAGRSVAGAVGQEVKTIVQGSGNLGEGQARVRAAANSIAKGRPSSRRQISDMTCWSSSPSKGWSGRMAWALSRNSVVASMSPIGGTVQVSSPSTASGSRLVARMWRAGAAARSVAATPADFVDDLLAVVKNHKAVEVGREAAHRIRQGGSSIGLFDPQAVRQGAPSTCSPEPSELRST